MSVYWTLSEIKSQEYCAIEDIEVVQFINKYEVKILTNKSFDLHLTHTIALEYVPLNFINTPFYSFE